jgi:predicted dehydrogenase
LGQYLPDWHPWEDYRQVYYAQKETGGCREMLPFELIWLTDIIGSRMEKVCGLTGKISNLEMSADDVYSMVVQFDNKIIGNVAIDLLARAPLRTLCLVGSDGVLQWEWLEHQLKIFRVKDKKWEIISLPRGDTKAGYNSTEEMYNEEIKIFLQAIDGRRSYPYTFKEDHQNLKLLYALEDSGRKNNFVKL